MCVPENIYCTYLTKQKRSHHPLKHKHTYVMIHIKLKKSRSRCLKTELVYFVHSNAHSFKKQVQVCRNQYIQITELLQSLVAQGDLRQSVRVPGDELNHKIVQIGLMQPDGAPAERSGSITVRNSPGPRAGDVLCCLEVRARCLVASCCHAKGTVKFPWWSDCCFISQFHESGTAAGACSRSQSVCLCVIYELITSLQYRTTSHILA